VPDAAWVILAISIGIAIALCAMGFVIWVSGRSLERDVPPGPRQ